MFPPGGMLPVVLGVDEGLLFSNLLLLLDALESSGGFCTIFFIK